ncbi:MAG: chemotaxis protein CheW [Desulfobacterales bacterium]|nr:chemotaxis protein CheW [Desulfobacterales bacterium]
MEKNGQQNKQRGSIKVLTFLLNNEMFAIPVSDIKEINRIARQKLVKNAPDFVLGIINFHGNIAPLIDTKILLSMEASSFSTKAKWLAVKYENYFVCLVVDEICGYLDINYDLLEKMPSVSNSPNLEYITCYAKIKDDILPVLNVHYLIKKNEKFVITE